MSISCHQCSKDIDLTKKPIVIKIVKDLKYFFCDKHCLLKWMYPGKKT